LRNPRSFRVAQIDNEQVAAGSARRVELLELKPRLRQSDCTHHPLRSSSAVDIAVGIGLLPNLIGFGQLAGQRTIDIVELASRRAGQRHAGRAALIDQCRHAGLHAHHVGIHAEAAGDILIDMRVGIDQARQYPFA